ncbi:MAG: GNAT family N-acetyltransferase [Oscillospiraceae bacterium]|nr:GNAT family N-acetyltransferase [Oscillospiraceae bacterium]
MEVTVTKYTDRDRAVWDRIYQSNPSLSAYQSPDFMAQFLKTAKFGKRRVFLKNEILMFKANGAEIICPVSVDERKKELFLLGDFSAVGYCDVIYSKDTTADHFEKVIDELKNRYPGYVLKFNKVNESSDFCSYLLQRSKVISRDECVSISFNGDYMSYYMALSKNTRQNIRTAYNRMKRDGKSFSFQIVEGKACLSEKQKNDMIRVYCTRMKDKFKDEVLPFPIMYIAHRYFNPIIKSLNTLDNKFHALLYIDGELAAFLSGLKNSDGDEIVVPRLAMNGKFDFYDPGIVLLRETAEYLCQECPNAVLDLSRGNEKYKYAMGGQTHFNYSFLI